MIPRVRTAVAGAAGLAALLVFSLLVVFPSRWVFFILAPAWLVVFVLFIRRLSRSAHDPGMHSMLAAATTLGCLALVSLAEWTVARVMLIILASFLAFLLSWMSVGESAGAVHEAKELRRLHMMLLTFDAGAILTALYAIAIFFPRTPLLLLVAAAGATFGAASMLVWRLYHPASMHTHAGVLVFALLGGEFFWVMHALPFGPAVSGVLTIWLWYVAQLLVRFHFGVQGVRWKEQRWFLLTNALLYAIVVSFFIRWV